MLTRTVSSLSMSSFSSSDHDKFDEELMVIDTKDSAAEKELLKAKRSGYACTTTWCVSCSLDGLFGKMCHPQCQARADENESDR